MCTQDSRIIQKRSTVAAVAPTVPSSNDHTDGTWLSTDIYKGELYYNQADNILYTRDDSGIVMLAGNTGCECLHSASLTITSAQVLALNSTPLTIVAAQGIGTAIDVISANMSMTFNSVAYATNVSIELLTSGATDNQASSRINNSASTVRKFQIATTVASSTSTQLVENADLQVKVATGNPTAGDSDITVYVLYRVITI